MYCRWVSSAVFVLIFVPHSALAAVVISEVAWMGSLDSANDEWIELHNNGTSEEVLDGWTLTDGQSLSIALSGTLPAQAYVVLERTDDSSAPGAAFLIYTGALPNTGATLRLINDAGALLDQVAGGDDWEHIGGDNVTKETAQLSSSGWLTAAPTPGRTNSSVGTPQTETKTTPSSGSGRSVIGKPVVRTERLIPSTKELSLALTIPLFVYVGQPAEFEVVPSAIGDTIVDSLNYEWNFGDLSTSTGKSTSHIYDYPGEYIVTVRAHFARHDVEAQEIIKVLPVRLSLTSSASGDVIVQNDSPYIVDVSGFTLQGNQPVIFPERSYIAVNGSVTVPHKAFGGTKLGQVSLADPAGATMAFLAPPEAQRQTPLSATVPQPVRSHVVAMREDVGSETDTEAFSFTTTIAEAAPVTTEELTPEEIVTETVAPPVATAAAVPAVPRELWPLGGLLGIIALGIFGIYFGAQKK